MRTIREVLDAVPTSADAGLDPAAVDLSRRLFGANRLTPLPREPLWRKFLARFDEPIIKILLAAALLSMFVDLFAHDPLAAGVALGVVIVAAAALLALRLTEWLPGLMFAAAVAVFVVGLVLPEHGASVEGLAVMVAVVLATGVAFLSEYRSDREFEVLNAQKESLRAKVIRGGEFHTVALEDVVVGDLVALEMGDEVPADGRLLRATDLYVDQSLMTGESEPAHKRPVPDDAADGFERPGCLYRGTQVTDGAGLMLVTEVGDATQLGQVARSLSAEDEDERPGEAKETRVKRRLTISKQLTPLQEKLKRLATTISKVGYVAAVLIFLALVAHGLGKGDLFWPHDPDGFRRIAGVLRDYFVYMVIIIVVAVPEGLPMSVTVSLALAMRRMTRENALVRQLVACETIGSATVICSDKTGTLTQNRMQVESLAWDGQAFDRNPSLPAPHLSMAGEGPLRPVDWIALNAAVNSTANLEEKHGKLLVVGNSTEGALLRWLRESGVDYALLRRQFPVLFSVHFSSDRKRMTSVVRRGGRLVSLVKGAPEWVLGHIAHYQAADGGVRPWTPEAREATLAVVRDWSVQAMRTLAFAYAELPPETPADEDALHARTDALESGLVFVGAAAIRDPLREDVKAAVAECRRAGIEVKMITGDNVETARAIAGDVGLVSPDAAIDAPDSPVMTSAALGALSDDELKARLPDLRVVARARPLDKYRLVRALQELGQVVAVTGDGTNDAPALKRADVGLAMGIAGTEVAKEASKIVLLDDAFSTIVKAVHWGRSLYENIQRFLQFQLTINFSALTIAFLGPFLGPLFGNKPPLKPPFTVLQLLWINVIMDTFAAMALCSEPPRPGVMRRPPRRRDESILTRSMLATIFTTAAFFVVVMLTLLAGMEWHGWFRGDGRPSAEFLELSTRQVSIFFTVYVFFQVWNQVNCRSLVPEESGLSRLGRNPTFLAIAAAVALGQVLIVSLPPLAGVFKVEPLGLLDWLWVVAGTASVLVFAEVVRGVRRALGTA